MSESSTPNRRDADDAHADSGPPTDAVSDEVKADAARTDTDLDETDDDADAPQDPSITHP